MAWWSLLQENGASGALLLDESTAMCPTPASAAACAAPTACSTCRGPSCVNRNSPAHPRAARATLAGAARSPTACSTSNRPRIRRPRCSSRTKARTRAPCAASCRTTSRPTVPVAPTTRIGPAAVLTPLSPRSAVPIVATPIGVPAAGGTVVSISAAHPGRRRRRVRHLPLQAVPPLSGKRRCLPVAR